MTRELEDQLTKYLTDAHSIEVQALAQLRTAPDIAGADVLAKAFRDHLSETEGHEQTTRELLEARDEKPSKVKNVVMGLGGKGFLLFARLQPDTPGKLFAHALSFEGLELASYELLRRGAGRARGAEGVGGAAAGRRAGGRAGRRRRRDADRRRGARDDGTAREACRRGPRGGPERASARRAGD